MQGACDATSLQDCLFVCLVKKDLLCRISERSVCVCVCVYVCVCVCVCESVWRVASTCFKRLRAQCVPEHALVTLTMCAVSLACRLDGVKIDGCGGERNIVLFQQLLNKTSTNFLIQDCHDSRAAPDPSVPRAPPNETWCPFNTWRNSYDEACVHPSPSCLMRAAHTRLVSAHYCEVTCRPNLNLVAYRLLMFISLMRTLHFSTHWYTNKSDFVRQQIHTVRHGTVPTEHERAQHRGGQSSWVLGNGWHADGRCRQHARQVGRQQRADEHIRGKGAIWRRVCMHTDVSHDTNAIHLRTAHPSIGRPPVHSLT
jgi:hypothetical protein